MGRTVNRGWFKKQVIAGNVEAVYFYNMTDDYKRDVANLSDKKRLWFYRRGHYF